MEKPTVEEYREIVECLCNTEVGDIYLDREDNVYYLVVDKIISDEGIMLFCRTSQISDNKNSLDSHRIICKGHEFGFGTIRNFIEHYLLSGMDNYKRFLNLEFVDNAEEYMSVIKCLISMNKCPKELNFDNMSSEELKELNVCAVKIEAIKDMLSDYQCSLMNKIDGIM